MCESAELLRQHIMCEATYASHHVMLDFCSNEHPLAVSTWTRILFAAMDPPQELALVQRLQVRFRIRGKQTVIPAGTASLAKYKTVVAVGRIAQTALADHAVRDVKRIKKTRRRQKTKKV